MMAKVSSSRQDGSVSHTREDSVSLESAQNMSQSSSASSSQDAQLHCSESMPSSTPSDESQRSHDDENALHNKCLHEITEMNGNKSYGTHQNEVSKLCSSVENNPIPTTTGQRWKSPKPTVSVASPENGENAASIQTHTLAAHANLSRLAEIATSQPTATGESHMQDAHQQPGIFTTQPINLVQPSLLATQRYLTPSQNVSLPVGLIQQNHFPVYGGYQQIPSGVFQHLSAVPLPQGQYPPPFAKGSIIQLASGDLKRVEDLTTEDFVQSTKLFPDLKLETSTAVLVNEGENGIAMVTFSVDSTKQQVTLNCPVEHPFFVYGQGWSSCRPEQTQARYSLHCQPLKVGDVCIFLSHATAAFISNSVTVISQGVPSTVAALTGAPTMPVTVSSGATGATFSVGSMSSDTAWHPRSERTSCSSEPLTVPEATRTYHTQASSTQGTHVSTSLNSEGIPHAANVPTQVSHYQALPATFLGGALHPQSLVPGAIVPQSSVGNGLLMAAIGIVPGRGVVPLTQQGTIYGSRQVGESLPKQASNGAHTTASPQQDDHLPMDSEDGQSQSKRRKVEGDGK